MTDEREDPDGWTSARPCSAVGLSRNKSANLVEAVLQHMSDALASRRARSRPSAPSRCGEIGPGRPQPKTGDEVPISPRRVLSFRPSHLMKDRRGGEEEMRRGQMDKSPEAFRTIPEVAEALTPALRFWESRFPRFGR